jgi:hypothetical protein
MPATPGILFRIDPISVARILEWTDEVEWQYVTEKIRKRGCCLVTRKNRTSQQSEMVEIREMPTERGVYAPLLGMVGGELSYIFHPKANGITLTVFAGYKIPGSDDYPTFTVELPQPLEHQVETDGFGILFVNEALFGAGDNFFGFTNKFFENFRAWNRYNENAADFEFEFQPLSIGCEVSVVHLESGERLHLTADVNW